MFSQHDPRPSPSMAGVSMFAPRKEQSACLLPAASPSQGYGRPFLHLSKADIKMLIHVLINSCFIGHRDNLGHCQDHTMY